MISSYYFDKGDSAPIQQDALVLEEAVLGNREAALLMVCDGIGGLSEGEYAGSYVTMRMRDWFYRDCLRRMKRCRGLRRAERDCVKVLYDCSRHLTLYGKEHGIRLGTTVTIALLAGRCYRGAGSFFSWTKYVLIHAGDSRAYLLGRGCRQLMEDDSDGNGALCRCIGSFPWQGVQRKRGCLRRGEKLLICSDGFWRRLKQEEMTESLGQGRRHSGGRSLTEVQLEKRLRRLGQAGRKRGEKDNQAAVCCAGGGPGR